MGNNEWNLIICKRSIIEWCLILQKKNVSNIRRPQTALPPTTKTLHRSKNSRKRKLPSHENTNNNQSKSNDNNGPPMKRRKINNNNGNYRKNNSKMTQKLNDEDKELP